MLAMPLVNLSTLTQFSAVNLTSDPGAVGGPVIIPQCAQIVINGTLESGHTFHIVTYGKYTGTFAGTPAQATAIITALTSGAQWTALAAFFATTNAFNSVTIRDVNVRDQPLIASTAGGALGTSASPSMPNEVALVITLRTAKVGRGNRGRMFVPAWATNALGAGNVAAAAAVTALQNWANTIGGIYQAQGYQAVLGQKQRLEYTSPKGVHHDARPAFGLPITQWQVRDNHWDTVRKRGLK